MVCPELLFIATCICNSMLMFGAVSVHLIHAILGVEQTFQTVSKNSKGQSFGSGHLIFGWPTAGHLLSNLVKISRMLLMPNLGRFVMWVVMS